MIVANPGKIPANATAKTYLKSVILLENAGFEKEANISYKKAYEKWPEDFETAFAYANSCYNLALYEKAKKIYLKILKTYPQKAVVWNNLAMTYLKTKEHNKALEAAKKAVNIGGKFKKVYIKTLEEIKSSY